MSDRRTFLQQLGVTSTAFAAGQFFNPLQATEVRDAGKKIAHLTPEEAAREEDYWYTIQQAYTVSPTLINLNNGGVSPQPLVVQEGQWKYIQMANEGPSYYMWRILDMGREPLRARLAALAGCSPEEIAMNRNSTEALDNAIFGIELQAGDEVILTKQDYPNMINAWKAREKRHGIKLVWLDLTLPSEDENYFVKMFTEAMTEKTKVLHITHMINWNGQLLPVPKISDAARSKNPAIKIIADCAHTFAHLDFKVPDLGADYVGMSLHKWLCAPFGTGMLYAKKDQIAALWPLFPGDKPDSEDIRKFEAQGTRSFPAEEAIGYAINFHEAIGIERKYARLQYLKEYWTSRVKDVPGVKIHSPLSAGWSGALCGFSIDGWEIAAIDSELLNKYKIHTVGINWENIHCVRVTPHVYTTIANLDKFVGAIKDMAANLPKPK